MPAAALVWFRRDLRDHDNAALACALHECEQVHCAFVFDDDILHATARTAHLRVEFLWHAVSALASALRARGGGLHVLRGRAREEIPKLALALNAAAVYANHDYDPAATTRDAAIGQALARCGVAFHTSKDIAVFEKSEILTQAGGVYAVFTPYKNAWLRQLTPEAIACHDSSSRSQRLVPGGNEGPAFDALGFGPAHLAALGVRTGMAGANALLKDFLPRLDDYHALRDYPAVKGVSYLSAHNRFGTCSPRQLVRAVKARTGAGRDTWLSELIWREFYFQILWHHPHVTQGAFKKHFDKVAWRNDEALFVAWCEGRTGYPIVDAAMRQIHRSGYMHNRLRMIVAAFLTKDLLVDWRWGERYFTDHLIDHDLAANNGGWQWAASTGCDAQPYFRIFNPVTQGERFDPRGEFVRCYVPELARVPDKFIHAPWRLSAAEQSHLGVVIGRDYPAPVVDHAIQRTLAQRLYQEAG